MKKKYLLSFTAYLSIWMPLCSIHNGYTADYVSTSQQGDGHEMSTSSIKRQRYESIVDYHQTYDEPERMTPLARAHSHHYAIATTDTAFKHLLSLVQRSDKKIDWWISVLKHAACYTDAVIDECYNERKIMPEAICNALKRLDLTTWNPREMKEYQEDMTRRDLYAEVLAVEREEGMKAGELKGREEGIVRAAVKAIQSGTIGREQAIALFELGETEMSVLDAMLSEGDVL